MEGAAPSPVVNGGRSLLSRRTVTLLCNVHDRSRWAHVWAIADPTLTPLKRVARTDRGP